MSLYRASHIINGVFVITALASLVAAGVYLFVSLAFGPGDQTVIYWLVYGKSSIDRLAMPIFVVCAPTGLLYVVVIRIFSRNWNEKYRRDIGVTAVVLALFSLMMFCGTGWIRVFQHGPLAAYRHLDTAKLNGILYHLTFYSGDIFERYFTYQIYECDRFDLLCTTVGAVSNYGIDLKIDSYNPDYEQTRLLANPNSGTLEVQINGETVYTHRVE